MMRAAFAAGLIFASTLGTASAAGLAALKVFPNPVRTTRGDRTVTFDGIGGGELQIFNSAGRLVFEKSLDPTVTSFVWDLKNGSGREVASGIYFYFITSGGDERTGKIGIIR